ncbi:tubulin/FtsZ family protein [Halobaculum halobium]|uniref:Tubulin-like protein CetZ n=1 Tax=Halobaculum halobium TaxID=3032281 RepID=A0ABD5THT3_9EURY|nr:tubulin/FtsZ family protein [Halobaculum sp. SYNS20]
MKVGLVAVGQAGGKIADALLRYERNAGADIVAGAVAVNTARADLLGLREVDPERRVLIGGDRVKGHGAGADNELGAEVARDDVDEIRDAIDVIPTSDVDAFLVVAALGGGTGSGGAPVICRELRRIYEEPVYALGVLPARDEGGIYTLNAARSLKTVVEHADATLLFDNDAHRESGESLAGGYGRVNDEIARRLGVLLSAGEARDPTPEKVVDASEIINTLGRSGGVASLGYASAPLERKRGLFGGRKQIAEDALESTTRVTATVRRAALGGLTLPCELQDVERALVVVSGPPEALSREGIEDARRWLETATGTPEVRGGDYPLRDTDHLSAAVLLGGVAAAPRLAELRAAAVEAQRNVAAIAERAELSAGIWDAEGLDPLF